MLELRASRRAEATIFGQVVDTFLSEFVKDVAGETLMAGLRAKKRAEDEVGLALAPTLEANMKRLSS